MGSNEKKMRNVERLGDKYLEDLENRWCRKKLESNWWTALEFFFNHSFMRGRRDKLSGEYCSFTIECLKHYFSIDAESPDEAYERLREKQEHFDKEIILEFKKKNGRKSVSKNRDFVKEMETKHRIIFHLVTEREVEVTWGSEEEKEEYTKSIYLGNDADVMMVLDVLKFISDDDKRNVYNYLKCALKTKGVKVVYEELQGLRSIGPKIAAFIIRDVGLMNSEIVKEEDYKMAFPVDTWVVQVAPKLGLNSKDAGEIIGRCKELDINPLKFAAGLWHLGAHSLDILLEHLGEINIKVEVNTRN